jgi:hypothetical protein
LWGDRFISQRGLNEDAAMKFGNKIEIFAPEAHKTGHNEESNDGQTQGNQNGNQPQRSESTASDEENRKMYTALLQN